MRSSASPRISRCWFRPRRAPGALAKGQAAWNDLSEPSCRECDFASGMPVDIAFPESLRNAAPADQYMSLKDMSVITTSLIVDLYRTGCKQKLVETGRGRAAGNATPEGRSAIVRRCPQLDAIVRSLCRRRRRRGFHCGLQRAPRARAASSARLADRLRIGSLATTCLFRVGVMTHKSKVQKLSSLSFAARSSPLIAFSPNNAAGGIWSVGLRGGSKAGALRARRGHPAFQTKPSAHLQHCAAYLASKGPSLKRFPT